VFSSARDFEAPEMAWTPYQIFLAFMMTTTGSINTLSAKWADNSVAEGIDGRVHQFDHPFLQACGMFMGEMLCLAAYFGVKYYKKYRQMRMKRQVDLTEEDRGFLQSRSYGVSTEEDDKSVPVRFNPLIFLPPALLDMTGTSVMYVGLNMTYASSFQMLRGSVIIFTGLLSLVFLRRKFYVYHWLGMLLIIVGLAVVGVADIITMDSTADTTSIITGDILIVLSQVVSSVQFVVEEKYIGKYNVPPLLAVGFEGLFGFTALSLLLIPMYYIYVPARFSSCPENRLEDALDGFTQMGHNWQIILATFGNVVSIAFFNFAGISVTKELSATTRMVLDSVRTLVVWAVSLGLDWQEFHGMQLQGFAALIIGMCIYNDLLYSPIARWLGWNNEVLYHAVPASDDEGVTSDDDRRIDA